MSELKNFKMTCDEPWFSLLRSGVKEVEGRKGLSKYRNLRSGDEILFVDGSSGKEFVAKVRKVDVFKSLDEYLRGVTLEKALPGVFTLEHARQIYYQWSTPLEIVMHGFVGIWIEVIPPPRFGSI